MIKDLPLAIFTYGTLRKGECNDIRRLGPAIFLGYARAAGFLHDLGNCPGLLLDRNGYPVKGELYEIQSSMLDELDRVEALCGEYHRRSIQVQHERLGSFSCFTYESCVRQVSGKPLIPSGDWIVHRQSRAPA